MDNIQPSACLLSNCSTCQPLSAQPNFGPSRQFCWCICHYFGNPQSLLTILPFALLAASHSAYANSDLWQRSTCCQAQWQQRLGRRHWSWFGFCTRCTAHRGRWDRSSPALHLVPTEIPFASGMLYLQILIFCELFSLDFWHAHGNSCWGLGPQWCCQCWLMWLAVVLLFSTCVPHSQSLVNIRTGVSLVPRWAVFQRIYWWCIVSRCALHIVFRGPIVVLQQAGDSWGIHLWQLHVFQIGNSMETLYTTFALEDPPG